MTHELKEMWLECGGEELTYDDWIELAQKIEANPPGADATKDEKIDWLVARKVMQIHRGSFN